MIAACFYWLTCIFELNFLFDRDWPGHLLLTTIKQNLIIFFKAFTFHYWVLHSNTWQWIVQIAKTLWKIQGYTPNLVLKFFDKASPLTWIRNKGALKNNHPVEMVYTFTPKKNQCSSKPPKDMVCGHTGRFSPSMCIPKPHTYDAGYAWQDLTPADFHAKLTMCWSSIIIEGKSATGFAYVWEN